MAKGFKDWDVPISISSQELDEIISRPKYGSAQLGEYEDTITIDPVISLLSVSGTGMIYGGYLTIFTASSSLTALFKIIIDGTTLFNLTLRDVVDININKENSYVAYSLLIDEAEFEYSLAISRGITFESSIQFLFRRTPGLDSTVRLKIFYAVI
ncbi:hypothetical protein LCGC14_0807900 [marine sediment metagenome]|uniref:Uncharacterized protein n=1 Tax=marine sediment metagenome TaxID=412755 RepID=A0A0F9S7N7_9ZZZZ